MLHRGADWVQLMKNFASHLSDIVKQPLKIITASEDVRPEDSLNEKVILRSQIDTLEREVMQ